jgi:pyroglutamyl-peptidase
VASAPYVLVTGFGPFPGRAVNPSREIARLLESEPPPGVRVLAAELPVSFLGAPRAVRELLERLAPPPPNLLLGLGVHEGPFYRLERRARGRYDGPRLDNDGRSAGELQPCVGDDLETAIELDPLAAALRTAGARDVRLSEDAGGYVCEITYHALLSGAATCGARAVFLHVPPANVLSASEQAPLVRAFLAELARA